MKLRRRKTDPEGVLVEHLIREFDLVASDFKISRSIMKELEHASEADYKLFKQTKGLDRFNATMQDPRIEASYNAEEKNALVQHIDNQWTLHSLDDKTRAAEFEVKELFKLLDSDYKINKNHKDKLEKAYYDVLLGSCGVTSSTDDTEGKEADDGDAVIESI